MSLILPCGPSATKIFYTYQSNIASRSAVTIHASARTGRKRGITGRDELDLISTKAFTWKALDSATSKQDIVIGPREAHHAPGITKTVEWETSSMAVHANLNKTRDIYRDAKGEACVASPRRMDGLLMRTDRPTCAPRRQSALKTRPLPTGYRSTRNLLESMFLHKTSAFQPVIERSHMIVHDLLAPFSFLLLTLA